MLRKIFLWFALIKKPPQGVFGNVTELPENGLGIRYIYNFCKEVMCGVNAPFSCRWGISSTLNPRFEPLKGDKLYLRCFRKAGRYFNK
jgi:hypothetical protein